MAKEDEIRSRWCIFFLKHIVWRCASSVFGKSSLASGDDGRVVFEGEPGMESLNPMGIIHGGWSLTIIDSACGCATMTALEPGVGYTTLETKVNMTRAIQPNSGIYRCEGTLLARGRQIITSEAKVTGPDGKLYAHGTSTCMVLRPKS